MKTHIFELTTFETREVVIRYTIKVKSEERAKQIFDLFCRDIAEGCTPFDDMSEDLEESQISLDDLSKNEQKQFERMMDTGEEITNSFRSLDAIYDKEYLGTDIP